MALDASRVRQRTEASEAQPDKFGSAEGIFVPSIEKETNRRGGNEPAGNFE
jgi:hypothetical protein